MKTITHVFLLYLFYFQFSLAQSNSLHECYTKQVQPLEQQTLKLEFFETRKELEHSFMPWQQTTYGSSGILFLSQGTFSKSDSLTIKGKKYISQVIWNSNMLFQMDYGDSEWKQMSKKQVNEMLLQTARYSPYFLLEQFSIENVPSFEDGHLTVYEGNIHGAKVSIHVSQKDSLVEKITIESHDELFGDVESTFTYSNYENMDGFLYPKDVHITKINGRLEDRVTIIASAKVKTAAALPTKPEKYKLQTDEKPKPEIKHVSYKRNIHLLELLHTDDRVLLVEFQDFFLAAEAPLNSENGELIIQEAKRIAPAKPIKYFVAGHYHPHYLGGIRAFVHKGAQIISTKHTRDYIRYIAEAQRSLVPDSLFLQPKSLLLLDIEDSLSISDGQYSMQIFFIGEKSAHTIDYLVYYFPEEKLLFEDDLVWIPKEGTIGKPSARQTGLYHAIKDLGIEVETIIQSWPVKDYGVKTVITFQELEEAVLP